MCISRSVGNFGRNELSDVKMIQTLLNLNRHRYRSARPARLKVDGLLGQKTIKTLRKYELQIMALSNSFGLVTAFDPTIDALRSGVKNSAKMDKEKLLAVMPLALENNIDRFAGHLQNLVPKYAIAKKIRLVHFIAQLAHESGSFRFTEELASGEAYEGRLDLGNVKRGDGKRFKGRGLIQLTGRANYQAYSDATGIDYVSKPKLLASDAKVAVDVACWFWKSNGLNQLSETDDVRLVTRRVNGGFNGIDDRIAFLRRAKCLVGMQ